MSADFTVMRLSLMVHSGPVAAESADLTVPSLAFAEDALAASLVPDDGSFGVVPLESLLADPQAERSDAARTICAVENDK